MRVPATPVPATPVPATPVERVALGDPGVGATAPPSGSGSTESSGQDGYDIKANTDSMLYHTTASLYHQRTRADVWFESESSAELAGFTRWDRRNRNAGATAMAFAAVDVPDGTYGPGSADPAEDGSGPDGYNIKGNANSMLYHTTESVFYEVTKPEAWFRTEDDAKRAGFRSFND